MCVNSIAVDADGNTAFTAPAHPPLCKIRVGQKKQQRTVYIIRNRENNHYTGFKSHRLRVRNFTFGSCVKVNPIFYFEKHFTTEFQMLLSTFLPPSLLLLHSSLRLV